MNTQNNMLPEENAAVQNVISTLGLDLLSLEEQEAFLDDLSKAAVEAAFLRGRMTLTEDKRAELDTLFEAAAADPQNEQKAEALATFFEKDLPSFDALFRAELEQLVAEYQVMREEAESEG